MSVTLAPPEFRDLRFRTTDRYELVQHDRLRPEEARRFEPLRSEPNHWGVLRPREAGSYRAIDRDTALLLFTLRESGPLPSYVFDEAETRDAASLVSALRAMVLDGILEAETAAGEPVPSLDDEVDDAALDVDPRSLAALRYGAALAASGIDDVRELSIRLYLYGGEPVRRSLCDRLATRRDLLEYLGLRGDRTRIPTGWRLDDAPDKGWIYLRRRERMEASGPAGSRGRCKLYVGGRFYDVPAVFAAVVAGLADSGANSMKVGSSVADLLRTDKIVVYFDAFEELQRFASDLSERLDDLDLEVDGHAVGVPFTAPAGGGGLLSWGIDPPDEAIPLEGTFTESWRAWVASRLAAALICNRDAETSIEDRLRTVIERVRLDGVDVTRWTPDAGLWRDAP